MRCQLARIRSDLQHIPPQFRGLLVWVNDAPPVEPRISHHYATGELFYVHTPVIFCLYDLVYEDLIYQSSHEIERLSYFADKDPQDLREWLKKGGEILPEE